MITVTEEAPEEGGCVVTPVCCLVDSEVERPQNLLRLLLSSVVLGVGAEYFSR